jgi:hypothetical protein
VLPLLLSACLGQVNAEALKAQPWKAGVSLGADASFFGSLGNVVFLDVGGAARAQWQTADAPDDEGRVFVRQRLFAVVSARYTATGRGPFQNLTFGHARWTAMWHPRVGTDVFAQVQTNQFLRMQVRAVGGPGVRAELVRTAAFALWGGSAVMFEYDRLSALEGSDERLDVFDVRWSTYLTARVALVGGRLLAQNTTYVQPRFDRFDDVRVLNETEVMARVTDAFMVGVTASVLHDTQPPMGVVPTDLRLLVTTRFSLDVAPPAGS